MERNLFQDDPSRRDAILLEITTHSGAIFPRKQPIPGVFDTFFPRTGEMKSCRYLLIKLWNRSFMITDDGLLKLHDLLRTKDGSSSISTWRSALLFTRAIARSTD